MLPLLIFWGMALFFFEDVSGQIKTAPGHILPIRALDTVGIVE